jgi:hypothetical protein
MAVLYKGNIRRIFMTVGIRDGFRTVAIHEQMPFLFALVPPNLDLCDLCSKHILKPFVGTMFLSLDGFVHQLVKSQYNL